LTIASAAPSRLFSTISPGSTVWILSGRRAIQHRDDAYAGHRLLRGGVKPVAQATFVHTVSAGYVTGSMFAVDSAFYLRRRYRGLAIRSLTVAVSFGLASALPMPRA
jgi:cytochrome bd ubiquinol oxidase subunit I